MSPPTPPLTHFRALSRHLVSLSGSLSDPGASWSRTAQVVDLGLGGACLELLDAPPPGEAVELAIEAPHLWDPLTLRGEIAWTRAATSTDAARAGIRFAHGSSASLRALTELLEAGAFG
jgi:hypothetical protein